MMATSIWATISAVFSTGVSIVLNLALLVVALTVVRKHRPECVWPIALAPVIFLVATIVYRIAYAAVPHMPSTVSEMSMIFAVLAVTHTAIDAIGWALLIFGIVKLATPPAARSASPLTGP